MQGRWGFTVGKLALGSASGERPHARPARFPAHGRAGGWWCGSRSSPWSALRVHGVAAVVPARSPTRGGTTAGQHLARRLRAGAESLRRQADAHRPQDRHLDPRAEGQGPAVTRHGLQRSMRPMPTVPAPGPARACSAQRARTPSTGGWSSVSAASSPETPAPMAPEGNSEPRLGSYLPPGESMGGSHRLGVPVASGTALHFDSGQRIQLTGPVVLGRSPARGRRCPATRVIDPDFSISKTHVLLRPVAGGLEVIDQGSTNGTAIVARRPRSCRWRRARWASPGSGTRCASVSGPLWLSAPDHRLVRRQ